VIRLCARTYACALPLFKGYLCVWKRRNKVTRLDYLRYFVPTLLFSFSFIRLYSLVTLLYIHLLPSLSLSLSHFTFHTYILHTSYFILRGLADLGSSSTRRWVHIIFPFLLSLIPSLPSRDRDPSLLSPWEQVLIPVTYLHHIITSPRTIKKTPSEYYRISLPFHFPSYPFPPSFATNH